MKKSNAIKCIRSDSKDPLFNKENMMKKVFSSDYRQIRFYTLLIIQSAPLPPEDISLLEQQTSEIIKNAVQHGNSNDVNKKVTVYYSFSPVHAHLIVEDEGDGFTDLDKWNTFYKKRQEILESKDFSEIADYVSFKQKSSAPGDGGNALCAAIEFWDGGIVFNDKKNAIAMLKKYPEKKE